ncbi:LytTR family DNA-binding domain-containing protein [Maricaulis parjimensis]|uniref:LytTR family DNA-binding domain-containing protein n=1 Tax=Maricaulis parjimensis TaxID=144023 RepID=UPI00193AB0EA|nr:LytTR family DNA-binding domain-containing protein [Maricaulis parjimensis]
MAHIPDEWLKALQPARTGLEALALCAFVLAALLFIPEPQIDLTAPPPLRHVDGSDGLARWQAAPETGERLPFYTLDRPDEEAWLIWEDVPLERDGAPPALLLSGPFSAEIVFNGEIIGAKGEPGPDAARERAGPIEHVTALPARLIRDEGNWIALRLSSHHAGYQPHTLVQAVFVVPYMDDARRPVRYYLPLVVTGSALLALIIALILRTRQTGDRRGLWLIAAMGGLVLAGLAEVSRSLINYPYDWHQPRQAISLLGLILFGLTLLRFLQQRWPAGPRTGQVWLGLTAAAMLAAALGMTGYDGKSAIATATAATSATAWLAWRGDASGRVLAIGLAVIAAYALRWPSDIIDRGVYAFTLALLAWPAIRQPGFLLPSPDAPPDRLALHMTGRTLYLDVAEISFLKAAGNYTEVHTRGGGQHLDNRNLAQVLDALPADRFFRQHRSHAVNLDEAASITASEGSRYRLQLKSGESLPVSRSQVAELKARLVR